MRSIVRRTDSQDIIDYSVDDDRGEGPHFITSAIDMDSIRAPSSAGLDSPISWRSEDDSKKGSVDPYHAV
jgi:hypothetical protein